MKKRKKNMQQIKPIHLILGSSVVLVIACFAMFKITAHRPAPKQVKTETVNIEAEINELKTKATQVKFDEFRDEVEILEEVVEEPISINDINIESNSIGSEHPVIESAFGFKIGDVFDKEEALATLPLTSGDTLYEVKPVKPYSGIGKYYITTDEDTNEIESIRGIETFESAEAAKEELIKLETAIERKYNNVHVQEEFRYYKDKKGNLILLFLKPAEEDTELHLHCLFSE